MNISLDNKRLIIAKIRNSKTFSKAPTSSSLLSYLFEETIKGTDLKEKLIEIEFFGESKSTEKSSPRVRVNVYNLRKKIARYYENEGKEDACRLHIEKGQYQLMFSMKKNKESAVKKIKLSLYIPYVVLFVVLLLFALSKIPQKAPAIWNSFVVDETKPKLIIGDAFGVMGNTATGAFGWNRDYTINSIEEFYQFCDNNPKLKNELSPANYTYMTGMGAITSQKITSLFDKYDTDFNIHFSSQTSIADLKDGNTIYAGPIKNNNLFIHFFNEANQYYKIKDSKLYFSKHPSIKDTTFNLFTEGLVSEYTIVSKYNGPNNHDQFVFFSDHDIGVCSTVEYFTNTDSLQKFTASYLDNSTYFTAVFMAKGKSRTNTDLKLLLVTTE
ncbi:hypothetical protein [Labilibaculum sp.]|uniref:hypothetical protein n=1 Tax=Labilibaculum sp. TaxID=2060723 RepID=UPI002AA7ED89|nr:hypothetical protein [Labilibaculum sp.]